MNTFEERGITHLDLHGVKHIDVDSEVIDFIFQYQDLLPLIINNILILILNLFLCYNNDYLERSFIRKFYTNRPTWW